MIDQDTLQQLASRLQKAPGESEVYLSKLHWIDHRTIDTLFPGTEPWSEREVALAQIHRGGYLGQRRGVHCYVAEPPSRGNGRIESVLPRRESWIRFSPLGGWLVSIVAAASLVASSWTQ